MIVLDACAAADLLLNTERAAAIAQVLRSVGRAHAPELIDPEVVAVIRRWNVALAELLGAELLTTDGRRGRAAQGLVDVAAAV